MRLLNIHTLQLEEFFGDKTPFYVILSHTWGQDEVTFDEWQLRHFEAIQTGLEQKQGYHKIIDACNFIKELLGPNWVYLWIDTICIDKRSSAELSEAINSMFAWYRDSSICLNYMVDVEIPSEDQTYFFSKIRQAPDSHWPELPDTVREQFHNSRWFTRGWTLQELLAPHTRLYIAKDWVPIGHHKELVSYISQASGIPSEVLDGQSRLYSMSVAQKMSWASKRETTRVEDTAYCLMGIFNVNMPLLYGEGDKAFRRLQMEIIKESADHSLFTWDDESRGSIFAPSPKPFGSQSQKMNIHSGLFLLDPASRPRPYYMTNIGLSITLPIVDVVDGQTAIVKLNCSTEPDKELSTSRLHLILRKIGIDQYLAAGVVVLGSSDWENVELDLENIYLCTTDRDYRSLPYLGGSSAKPALGRAFMLAYSWKTNHQQLITSAYPDHNGRWVLEQLSFQNGFLRLHRTEHGSGTQILVLRIADVQTSAQFWCVIVYHPERDWFVYLLGNAAPTHQNYTALVQYILEQKERNDRTGRYEYRDGYQGKIRISYCVQKPVWPLAYKEFWRDNFQDRCPFIFFKIETTEYE